MCILENASAQTLFHCQITFLFFFEKHVGMVGHYTSPEAEQQSQDLIYSYYDLFSFAQVNAIRHPHVQKYFSKRLMARKKRKTIFSLFIPWHDIPSFNCLFPEYLTFTLSERKLLALITQICRPSNFVT